MSGAVVRAERLESMPWAEIDTARAQGLTRQAWVDRADAAAQLLHAAMTHIGAQDRLAHAPESRQGCSPRYQVALPLGGPWDVGSVKLHSTCICTCFDSQGGRHAGVYGVTTNSWFPGHMNPLNGKWNHHESDVFTNVRAVVAVANRIAQMTEAGVSP